MTQTIQYRGFEIRSFQNGLRFEAWSGHELVCDADTLQEAKRECDRFDRAHPAIW